MALLLLVQQAGKLYQLWLAAPTACKFKFLRRTILRAENAYFIELQDNGLLVSTKDELHQMRINNFNNIVHGTALELLHDSFM